MALATEEDSALDVEFVEDVEAELTELCVETLDVVLSEDGTEEAEATSEELDEEFSRTLAATVVLSSPPPPTLRSPSDASTFPEDCSVGFAGELRNSLLRIS